jgi:hypothetical protein
LDIYNKIISMKKIIKLTETELNRIIKKVITEQTYRTGNLDNPEDFLPKSKPEPRFKTPEIKMPAPPQFKPDVSSAANTSKGFVPKTKTPTSNKSFGVLRTDQNPTKTFGVNKSDANPTPSFGVKKSDANLGIGARGPQVVELQQALKGNGYRIGPTGADGKFGPITQESLKGFQEDNGLPVTGVADPKTLNLLKSKASSFSKVNKLTNPLQNIKNTPIAAKTSAPVKTQPTGGYKAGTAGMY